MRGFTRNFAKDDTDFWNGMFLDRWIDARGEDHFQQGKAQIIAHAFQTSRVLDMSCVSERSRNAIERCTHEHELINDLVSPTVIVGHVRTLLHYVQHAYPLPQIAYHNAKNGYRLYWGQSISKSQKDWVSKSKALDFPEIS